MMLPRRTSPLLHPVEQTALTIQIKDYSWLAGGCLLGLIDYPWVVDGTEGLIFERAVDPYNFWKYLGQF